MESCLDRHQNGALIFDGETDGSLPTPLGSAGRRYYNSHRQNGAAYIGTEIGLYIIDGTGFLGYNRWLPDFKVTAIAVSSDGDTRSIGEKVLPSSLS